MTEAATSPESVSPPPHPSAGRRSLRWLWRSLAAFLLLLLVLAATSFFGVRSEPGARALWQLSTWAMHGNLSGQLIGGTVADGLQLRNLVYRDATQQYKIDRIDAKWRLSLSPLKLDVAYLRVGIVDARLGPTPPEPSVMPSSLELPLQLVLNDISLKQLSLHQGLSTTELSHLQLHGQSDRVQHNLVLERLDTPYGKASAKLSLNGVKPFALSGGAELSGEYQKEKYQLDATLSGSLAALNIDLNARGDKLSGTAKIAATPFAPIPFQQLELNAAHINPKLFSSGAPQADLSLQAALKPVLPPAAAANASAVVDLSTLTVSGPIRITNAMAGALDQDRLPLVSASAELRLDAQTQQLSQLQLKLLKNASIDGQGEYHSDGKNKHNGEFNFNVTGLDLQALHGKLKPTQLRGPLSIKLTPENQQISLSLADATYQAKLETVIDARQIVVKTAQLAAGAARLDASGSLGLDAGMAYAVKGSLRDFNPFLWINSAAPVKSVAKGAKAPGAHKSASQAVTANINLDADASGNLTPELKMKLKFAIRDSRYDQLPMTGNGLLNLAGTRLLPSDVALSVAGNEIHAKGSFGAAGDHLDLKIDAPQLQGLGFGISGAVHMDGQLSGTLQKPNVQATYRAEKLVYGEHRVDSLSGQADVQADLNAKLNSSNNRLVLSVDGRGLHSADMALDRFKLDLSGTYAAHNLKLDSSGTLHGKPLHLTMAAQGQLNQGKAGYGWQGQISELQNQGTPRISLGAPLSISADAGRLLLGATRLNVADAQIDLKNFSYDNGKISSAGAINALNVATVLGLMHEFGGPELPLKTDLVLDSSWDFSLAENLGGYLQIARRSGDLRVNPGRGDVSLGLSELKLRADLQAGQIKLDSQLAASRIGTLNAQLQLALQHSGSSWTVSDSSALSGQAKLQVPHLKSIGALIGPQVALDGSIAMDLNLAGQIGKPVLSGKVSGDQLAVTLFDQGIKLKDGTARLNLANNVVDLQQLEFHGGDGAIRATGRLQLGHDNPDLSATVIADRLQLFASPDRQLMLSGQAKIANLKEQLHVDGKFTVDKALFDLPKSSAPVLGDDVVIVRKELKARATPLTEQEKLAKAAQKPASGATPVINVEVDFGNDFRFRGSGADILLRGAMQVRSEPYQPLRATGTIRVASGSYEVFGRKLAIERGLINFQGPIDNPNINILAMKRNQEVEAGAEITGTPSNLRVKLVSEPNVSDEEKLSWLMFGHGSDSSALGQRAAASQALALLGGIGGKKIAQGIGFDEFSIGSSDSGIQNEQVVSLGKVITEKINLGYEQGLTTAASVLKLTWQFSRRWSMVMRGGTINGLEVLYNLRFD
ncbi:translocation/assembly module TamB domain-containing protein [Collimonas sp.]|jgi:translocation and assembly module TamB|uniref:translocation/assembly module TamB domain-containing protein n=1 Tax=Collimonas sp. TaxID=1963772 RepID=UPI002BD4470C|nr:translocation/assembly module TamB domain-containing protein [Collimonas sp.]HWW07370.1 translocation/assembly module TamB domain-containing protein [Collimonas sp.]